MAHTLRRLIGFWPANSRGDDIVLFADRNRHSEIAIVHTLRQQMVRRNTRPNIALADHICPEDAGPTDYMGGFVVTAGSEIDAIARRLENANDDSAILAKALAEAFAERMHQRVRTEFWGYATGETLSNDKLITEEYRGIRPAPGYPACPDHTGKRTLFRLLDAETATGVCLTETFAMWSPSSVSGYYLAHPEARYFGVGRIERDQVGDYAGRKGIDTAEAERWLAPGLRGQSSRHSGPLFFKLNFRNDGWGGFTHGKKARAARSGGASGLIDARWRSTPPPAFARKPASSRSFDASPGRDH